MNAHKHTMIIIHNPGTGKGDFARSPLPDMMKYRTISIEGAWKHTHSLRRLNRPAIPTSVPNPCVDSCKQDRGVSCCLLTAIIASSLVRIRSTSEGHQASPPCFGPNSKHVRDACWLPNRSQKVDLYHMISHNIERSWHLMCYNCGSLGTIDHCSRVCLPPV